MKRYQEDFQAKLSKFDFSTLKNSKATIFALSKKFELLYFNPAFLKFAQTNSSNFKPDPNFALVKKIFHSLGGKKIQEFYLFNYKNVLKTGEVWHHKMNAPAKINTEYTTNCAIL